MKDDTSPAPLPALKPVFEYDRELEDIYLWLPKQCNDYALGTLITKLHDRDPRAKKEITKTGNIDHKVRQLRRAVGYGLLKKEELAQLLQDCEESGQQWIYLFKPDGKHLSSISDPEIVRSALQDAGTKLLYPKFSFKIDGLVWADFRTFPSSSKRGEDWVLKIYQHSQFRKKVDSGNEKRNDDTIRDWTDYQYHDAYLTHVVRWRSNIKLLEVRIDKEKSLGRKAEQNSRYDAVVDFLQPAIPVNSLKACSLEKACTDMLNGRRTNAQIFRFGHIRFVTKDQGKTHVFPYDSTTALDSDQGRSNAVDELLRCGGRPIEACINFKVLEGMEKPNSVKEEVDNETGNDDELRTIITGKRWNEVSISSRITPKLLDHVIYSLCRTYAE